jgi:hypothetical protein
MGVSFMDTTISGFEQASSKNTIQIDVISNRVLSGYSEVINVPNQLLGLSNSHDEIPFAEKVLVIAKRTTRTNLFQRLKKKAILKLRSINYPLRIRACLKKSVNDH